MDKKPPRPRTLALSSNPSKKASRQKKTQSWVSKSERQMDLHYLANDIKGIIKGISFEKSSDTSGATRESFHRSRAYIVGGSSVDDTNRRPGRRGGDFVSSYYREREDRDNLSREIHVARTGGMSDSYTRDRERSVDTQKKRVSCPWNLYFEDEREENRSLELLATELRYVQGIRDKEVRELLGLNTKLQDDLYDSETEICSLKETNSNMERRMSDMLQVYERIKGNLKRCLTKVKGLEQIGKLTGSYSDDDIMLNRNGKDLDQLSISSGFNTQSDVSESVSLGPGYEGDGEGSICADIGRQLDEAINGDGLSLPKNSTNLPNDKSEILMARPSTPNKNQQMTDQQLFMGRLQADVDSLSQINREQSLEIERLRSDLSSCRKHMMSSQFQLEAVEIECSRLLSMEDQLITVITLLQRAREQHVHRQVIGDIVLTAITMTMAMEDDSNPGRCVDTFLREIQERLALNPSVGARDMSNHGHLEGASSSVRSALSGVERVARENRSLLENLKFIDDEEAAQGSDNDSFHSLGKHLNDTDITRSDSA